MRIVIIVALGGCLAGCATVQPLKGQWTTFADCAGAYLANAAVVDPGRSASMSA